LRSKPSSCESPRIRLRRVVNTGKIPPSPPLVNLALPTFFHEVLGPHPRPLSHAVGEGSRGRWGREAHAVPQEYASAQWEREAEGAGGERGGCGITGQLSEPPLPWCLALPTFFHEVLGPHPRPLSHTVGEGSRGRWGRADIDRGLIGVVKLGRGELRALGERGLRDYRPAFGAPSSLVLSFTHIFSFGSK